MMLSILLCGAYIAASHTCPSCNSPSPINTYTKLLSLFNSFACAAPIATDKPCPKEPEAIRIPGKPSCVVGWPCKRQSTLLQVASPRTGEDPGCAEVL